MKKIIFIFLFFTFQTVATDLSLVFGGYSKHYTDKNQNEFHPSIGLEAYDFSVVYVSKNSIYQESYQVSYSNVFYETENVDFGYRFGIATGYKKGTVFQKNRVYSGLDMGGGTIPIVALELVFDTPLESLDFVVDISPTVAMFGMKMDLWSW